MASDDLFTLPAGRIDYDAVRSFVLRMEALNALTESVDLELKSALQKQNVVRAVAGLANADGGLVLVGVSEDLTGEPRLVGVKQDVYDSLVSQLQVLLGIEVFSYVELIPVAKPSTGLLIIVVRVDADQAPRPVVLSGTVHVRMPGQTALARREDILRLAASDADTRLPESRFPTIAQRVAPAEPMRYPFWSNETEPAFTIRIHASLVLPVRSERTPWISSDAKAAAQKALQESPVPDRLLADYLRAFELSVSSWVPVTQKAVQVNWKTVLNRETNYDKRPLVRAEAFLYREHRTVGLLLAIGFDRPPSGKDLKFTLAELHQCILAGCVTAVESCRAVADALDVASPAKPGTLEGWLQTSDRFSKVYGTSMAPLQELPVIDEWGPVTSQTLGAFGLALTVPYTGDAEELDELVRQWLTLLFLDLGLNGFEPAIEALEVPTWEPAPDA